MSPERLALLREINDEFGLSAALAREALDEIEELQWRLAGLEK